MLVMLMMMMSLTWNACVKLDLLMKIKSNKTNCNISVFFSCAANTDVV